MTQMLTVGELSFQLKRSQVRGTLGITVERDGTLVLAAPATASTADLEAFVDEKWEWIYSKLGKKSEYLARRPPPKEYVTGEGFWYLGRTHQLRLVRSQKGQSPLRLHNGRFLLSRDRAGRGHDIFVEWYRDHLRPRVTNLSDDYARRLDVEHNGVYIQTLGHRWGSCGRTGRLNYHWRSAMLLPNLMEYVVAHEVAHLVEPGHGGKYWAAVESLLPDWTQRKDQLATEGVKYAL